jgi:hypothetical protein
MARHAGVGIAALLVGLTATAGAAGAGSSVEARAVAAARRVAAQAADRAQSMNQMVAGTTPRPVPVPAKAGAPARSVPAAAAVPVKTGNPAVRAPQGGRLSMPATTQPVAKPATGRTQAVRPPVAAVAAAVHPTMNPVPAPSPSAAHLDNQVTYQYNALGRRDPFLPLVGGAIFVPVESPPDIGAIHVVGIVWGAQDKFAIIEDGRGNSSVLRPGDKVMNGFVEGLKRDGVVVTLTADGQTQSVTIPLTRKGDSNANR